MLLVLQNQWESLLKHTEHQKNLTDGEIAKKVEAIFDMRPYFIEQRLKLRNPIYSETAAYGHMGRMPETVTKFQLQVD
jgi:S-adenosylmethionine synthetase